MRTPTFTSEGYTLLLNVRIIAEVLSLLLLSILRALITPWQLSSSTISFSSLWIRSIAKMTQRLMLRVGWRITETSVPSQRCVIFKSFSTCAGFRVRITYFVHLPSLLASSIGPAQSSRLFPMRNGSIGRLDPSLPVINKVVTAPNSLRGSINNGSVLPLGPPGPPPLVEAISCERTHNLPSEIKKPHKVIVVTHYLPQRGGIRKRDGNLTLP